ncbi:hypothetical protein D7030_05050 [Flavobacteriaceae bacterium AU392]|nr:hypothetical protein D1817_11525 [Flavobacteriaceae bacterium]RKM86044.1 hypothetical protein D7030_05050 [Flavobacteriaceae bacterium AU392]
MTVPINIHNSGAKIYLSAGIYNVNVLGGWGVEVNGFSFSLKKVESDLIIKPRNTKWRVQSYAFKMRAKRILILDISEQGEYIIEFKNPKNLRVRRSNLFITQFFEDLLSNENLEICIGC